MRTLMSLKTIAALLAPVVWASSDLDGHCNSDHAVSFIQTRAAARQPFGVADRSLQAPAEGGPFSEFYNNRHTGNGIHKWLQYFPAYERHLAKFIGKEVHIVEIGIQSGGSMDMWKGVFGPGARVYGCDINPKCKSYEDEQTKIFIGDQESPAFWEDFRKQVPRIDILIDDGGHTVEQQIATLGIMLQHLSPDGVYITEDVHGSTNGFWQNLEFEKLSSPGGKLYTGLSSLISSVHVYPYLLVIEGKKNIGNEEMLGQLGISGEAKPAAFHTAVVTADAQPTGPLMQETLRSTFPWFQWSNETVSDVHNVEPLLEKIEPNGWLFVRDGTGEFSFDAPWDAQTDAFMKTIISDFRLMHDGNCCNWNANNMQQKVDSLHIYPHLLVAQRTASEDRLVKAPQHGTQWIPY